MTTRPSSPRRSPRSPITFAAPVTARCWPERCISADPISCTGSRSGSRRTFIPQILAGLRTGIIRMTGRPGITTCRRSQMPVPACARTSLTTTTKWRSPPSGRCSAMSAHAMSGRSATWSRSLIRMTLTPSRPNGGTCTGTRTYRCQARRRAICIRTNGASAPFAPWMAHRSPRTRSVPPGVPITVRSPMSMTRSLACWQCSARQTG